MDGRYCAYLRKSRADEVREKLEEGYDALAHHRAMLVELAQKMQVDIARWYSDGIKSGASLENRDGMRRLLNDVGMWDGVLCVEVERLTRGDMVDQGTVLRAFSEAGTLIVTPQRVYDPASEADQSYLEFGLFMSRFEFKTINKRLIAGRIASVKEGQYIGQRAPYGYDKVKIDGKHTLVPNGKAKWVVRMFEMFADGMSYRDMAAALESMGAETYEGGRWIPGVVRRIVMSPVYAGKVVWNATKQTVYYENGIKRHRTVPNPDVLVVDGLHEPIVTPELWERAKRRVDAAPVRGRYVTRNHYGRVLVCAKCGAAMKWNAPTRKGSEPYIRHAPYSDCTAKSCRVSVLDAAVVGALESIARNLDAVVSGGPKTDGRESAEDCRAEARRCRQAVEDNFDRMERGVISEADFVERRRALEARAEASDAEAERLESLSVESTALRAMAVRDCIRAIGDPEMDAEAKRKAVWSLIERIEYRNDGGRNDDRVELEIFLRP